MCKKTKDLCISQDIYVQPGRFNLDPGQLSYLYTEVVPHSPSSAKSTSSSLSIVLYLRALRVWHLEKELEVIAFPLTQVYRVARDASQGEEWG